MRHLAPVLVLSCFACTEPPPIGLDANVKAKLETLAQRQDVVVETHVLDRGFLVDGGTGALLSSLLEGGLSSDTFAKVDAIRNAMLASLAQDAAEEASGDAIREAVPVNVDLRPYARATNALIGGPGSAFEKVRHLVDGADRHLRELSRVAARADAVLDDELAPYLSATSDARARYGIAPPAAPVYRPSELVDIARRHHDRITAAKSEVDARIGDCWNAAVEGALDACAVPLPPAVATVDAALVDYAATGRIVPVRFAAKGVLGYGGAKDAWAAACGCRRSSRRSVSRCRSGICRCRAPAKIACATRCGMRTRRSAAMASCPRSRTHRWERRGTCARPTTGSTRTRR